MTDVTEESPAETEGAQAVGPLHFPRPRWATKGMYRPAKVRRRAATKRARASRKANR